MAPINKILKVRISDEVMEQMKKNIISGEWSPGSKIPGEMDLVSLFGISRISVRQAIHQLVGMGVLIIKRGEGTFVTDAMPSQYFNILIPYLMIEKPDISDVFEYRCILESKSAYLAAERADEEDIKALEELLIHLKEIKNDYEEYVKYDVSFHTVIASATKNSVILKITSILSDILKSTMREAIEFVGFDKGNYFHSEVLKAIKSRDPILAEKQMSKHLNSSWEAVKKIRYKK